MVDAAINILLAFLMGFVSGCLVLHTVILFVDREEELNDEEGTSDSDKRS